MAAGPTAPAQTGPGPQEQLRLLLFGGLAWCVAVLAYAAYHLPEAPLASPELIQEQYDRRMNNIPVTAESQQYHQYKQYYKQQYDINMQEYREYLEQWKKSQPCINWGVLFTGMCNGGMIFAAMLAYLEYHCGAISYLMEKVEAMYNWALERWAAYRERCQAVAMEKLLHEMGEGRPDASACGAGAGGSHQATAAGRAGATGSSTAKKGRRKLAQELERTSSSASSSPSEKEKAPSTPSTAASTPAATPVVGSKVPAGDSPSETPRKPSPVPAPGSKVPAGDSPSETPLKPSPVPAPGSKAAEAPKAQAAAPEAAPAPEPQPVQAAAAPEVVQALKARPPPADAEVTARSTPAKESRKDGGRRVEPDDAPEVEEAHARPAPRARAPACKQHPLAEEAAVANARAEALATPLAFSPGGAVSSAPARLVEVPALTARERLRRKMSERARQQCRQQTEAAAAGKSVASAPVGGLKGAELMREAEELLSQLEAQELLRQLEAEERKTPASQKRKAKRKAAAAAKDGGAEAPQAPETPRQAEETPRRAPEEEEARSERAAPESPRSERAPEPAPRAEPDKQDKAMGQAEQAKQQERREKQTKAAKREQAQPEVRRKSQSAKREKSPEATPEAVETGSSRAPSEAVANEESQLDLDIKGDKILEAVRPLVEPATASKQRREGGGADEVPESSAQALSQESLEEPEGAGAPKGSAKWADVRDDSDDEAKLLSPRDGSPRLSAAELLKRLPPPPSRPAPASPGQQASPAPASPGLQGKGQRGPAVCVPKPTNRTAAAEESTESTSCTTEAARVEESTDDEWTCDECGELLQDGSKFCPNCGVQLAAPASAAPASAAPASVATSVPEVQRHRCSSSAAPSTSPVEARRGWGSVEKPPKAGSEESPVEAVLKELQDLEIAGILDWFQANHAQDWLFQRMHTVGEGKEDLLGLARELVEEQLQADGGDKSEAGLAKNLRAEAPEFVPGLSKPKTLHAPMSPCANVSPVMCMQGNGSPMHIMPVVQVQVPCQVFAVPLDQVPDGAMILGPASMMSPMAASAQLADAKMAGSEGEMKCHEQSLNTFGEN